MERQLELKNLTRSRIGREGAVDAVHKGWAVKVSTFDDRYWVEVSLFHDGGIIIFNKFSCSVFSAIIEQVDREISEYPYSAKELLAFVKRSGIKSIYASDLKRMMSDEVMPESLKVRNGDEVWLLGSGIYDHYQGRAEVSKVGRKFFYITQDEKVITPKFLVKTNQQDMTTSGKGVVRVYTSKEEYDEYFEHQALTKKLRERFAPDRELDLSLAQMRAINRIIW